MTAQLAPRLEAGVALTAWELLDAAELDIELQRSAHLADGELATLAGVSIDYLIRLEQGRDARPSPAVLAALAKPRHLTDGERTHMVRLIAHKVSAPLCPTNLARHVFLHPSAQSVYPDWARAADEQASRLRAASRAGRAIRD